MSTKQPISPWTVRRGTTEEADAANMASLGCDPFTLRIDKAKKKIIVVHGLKTEHPTRAVRNHIISVVEAQLQ